MQEAEARLWGILWSVQMNLSLSTPSQFLTIERISTVFFSDRSLWEAKLERGQRSEIR